MAECVICYEPSNTIFQPANKPPQCVCQYTIHESCYKNWLQECKDDFHCVICHTKIEQRRPLMRFQLRQAQPAFQIDFYQRLIVCTILLFVIYKILKYIMIFVFCATMDRAFEGSN